MVVLRLVSAAGDLAGAGAAAFAAGTTGSVWAPGPTCTSTCGSLEQPGLLLRKMLRGQFKAHRDCETCSSTGLLISQGISAFAALTTSESAQLSASSRRLIGPSPTTRKQGRAAPPVMSEASSLHALAVRVATQSSNSEDT